MPAPRGRGGSGRQSSSENMGFGAIPARIRGSRTNLPPRGPESSSENIGLGRFRPESGGSTCFILLYWVRMAPPEVANDLWSGTALEHRKLLVGSVGRGQNTKNTKKTRILCYAIGLPGRKSGFRAGFRPDSIRESLKLGPPVGLRQAGGPIFIFVRLESGRN